MKSYKIFLFLLFLITKTISYSQINDIKVFLEQCPTNDPLIDTILKDFQFRLNDEIVTEFPCTEPISAMSVEQYTQPLIYLQTLRVAYYMDRNMRDHLPWTDTTLYVWIKDKIDGIKVSDSWASGGYCCDVHDGKIFMVTSNADETNREFDKGWRGIAGNLDFVAHEVRHQDGNYSHTSCCPSTSCDSTYNEENLSCFGVQYWLNKSWLTEFINVGASVSHTQTEIGQIVTWHMSALNDQFRERFCFNAPAIVEISDFEHIISTPVEEIYNDEISVYPNPANNTVFIKNINAVEGAEIVLSDMLGHIIRKSEIVKLAPYGEYRFDISNLNRGFYLITVNLKSQSLNYKFFKE